MYKTKYKTHVIGNGLEKSTHYWIR